MNEIDNGKAILILVKALIDITKILNLITPATHPVNTPKELVNLKKVYEDNYGK